MAGAGRIKGITIEIGGNTTKLVSALKDVDKQIKNTQTALKDVNKLLKLDPGNTELLRQKQKLLTDAIGQTKDRLEQLKSAQSQVAQGSDDWDALQREIIETEQDLDSLNNQMKDFGSVTAQKLMVVGDKFKEVGGKIEAAGQSMAKISGASAGALAGIAKLGYDAVTAADDLNTLSKQTGVSTDELQKWNYAADLVDVSTDTITGAMRKMKKNIDSNSDAFESLGVKTTYNSGRLRDSTDIFYDTIEALSHIQDETERDIAAMEIFGKSADDLAGVIDDGGAALKAYGEEAENLGLIISGDTLDKLNETNDTIDRLKATMAGSLAQAGATIAQTFAPAVEKAAAAAGTLAEKIRSLTPGQAELITKILAVVAVISPALIIVGKIISAIGSIIGVIGKLVGVIGPLISSIGGIQGVLAVLTGPIGIVIAAIGALTAAFVYFYNTNEEFRNKVNEVFGQVKEFIGAFIEQVKAWFQEFLVFCQPIFEQFQTLGTALGEFFQALIPVIMAVINQITSAVSAFVSTHRTEIEFILKFIKEEVSAAFDIVRTYIQTVLNVITNIVRAFTSALKGDWSGALNYLKAAAESAKNGLISIFQRLGEMLRNIFSDIVSRMRQWGSDMIGGLVQGIQDKVSAVTSAVSGIASTIKSYLHFSEPDVGPLSNFHTYAPDMMRLFAQGIRENAGLITEAIGSSFDLRPYFTSMNNGINRIANASNTSAQGSQGPVVVNVSLEGDAQRLFRVLSEEAHRDWQITGQSRLMGY